MKAKKIFWIALALCSFAYALIHCKSGEKVTAKERERNMQLADLSTTEQHGIGSKSDTIIPKYRIDQLRETVASMIDTTGYKLLFWDTKGTPWLHEDYAYMIREGVDEDFYCKIIFFDATGVVRSILDIDALNPYTKEKYPELSVAERYNSEAFSILPKSRKPPGYDFHKDVDRYLTYRAFVPMPCGNYALYFSLLGLQGHYFIDEWSTHHVLDSNGNVIMSTSELNVSPWEVRLGCDMKYYIINFGKKEDINNLGSKLSNDGFVVFDVSENHQVYYYELEDATNNRSMEGAFFDDVESDLVIASITLPNSPDLDGEKIIIDFENQKEYSRTFTKKEWEEITLNWIKKYGSYRSLLTHFKFNKKPLNK